MKKIVLTALGLLGLAFVMRHRRPRHEGRSEMFEWWSPDV